MGEGGSSLREERTEDPVCETLVKNGQNGNVRKEGGY